MIAAVSTAAVDGEALLAPARSAACATLPAMRAIGVALACGALLLSALGCAGRRAAAYRIVGEPRNALLAPPGVQDLSVDLRTFTVRPPDRHADCRLEEPGIAVVKRRRKYRISIARETLTARPPGWLTRWTDLFSERGCLAPSRSGPLATRIAQSFPLELRHAYSVLFGHPADSSFMDFLPGRALKVVGPVFRGGAASGRSAVASASDPKAAGGARLSIDVRASEDLIGYEESWYAIRETTDGGIRVEHERTAFFHDGEAESLDAPLRTGFAFAPQARFMRMIYLTRVAESGDHDVLFLAAPTRRELETRSTAVLDDPRTCSKKTAESWCATGPSELSFNLYVAVERNGTEERIAPGTTLGDFLRMQAPAAGGDLEILRPYGDRLAKVDFDPSSGAIFSLPLLGGEKIRWLGAKN